MSVVCPKSQDFSLLLPQAPGNGGKNRKMLAMKNDGRIGKPKKEQKLLMCLRFTELENDFGTWHQVMLGLGMSCGYPPVQPAAPVSATSPGSCGTWK
jgi:hypothetical protein